MELGICAEDARRQLAGFLSVIERKRPFLTLKLALSLDGRIATATGESQWITSPDARRAVHAMRANHDAVLVGGGTARTDDPSLTVRDMGVSHQPLRVVASRRLELPWPSKLSDTIEDGPVWLLHGAGEAPAEPQALWSNAGANLLAVPLKGRQLDLAAALEKLAEQGVTRVFCEGGGAFAASLLETGLVDELVVFSAGKVLGAEGTPGIGALGLDRLQDAPNFVLIERRTIGPDILHRWAKP